MDYDILIIGGGMVGASLAHALKEVPLRIGLVEAVPLAGGPPGLDTRAIALAQGSKRILGAMGVWDAVEALGVSPIRQIHISDKGHFGTTRLSASEEGVEALGYVAEAGVIGRGLMESFDSLHHAELICPATFRELEFADDHARVEVEEEGRRRTLTCKLVVAADGGRSEIRERVGAGLLKLGYGQTAIIAHVVTDRSHGGTAYERFTDSGPMALLPNTAPEGTEGSEQGDRRWSLVWTVRDEQVDEVLQWDDATFLQRLQVRFGRRAGTFRGVGPRCAYPLGLQFVRDPVRRRLAFIGNAAHIVHPVAGQGFNLGLRDAAVLAEVLADAVHRGSDPGTLKNLRGYARWRRPDYLRVMAMTDGLARTFSNDFLPAVVARNLGLIAMEMLPPARHLLARQAMGLTGRLPRLARGLPVY
ncbi:2-octaprenyl-6-methoxyphenyl hydroxylase [Thiohalomonas denitrificans]|uniref:2-octaprenyl-6-methoxyphenol hydroxylase n=1 Tax=Thiohalomonas denitrificans TaxID=415747 RepID=A0A1G5R2N1_9GAMM|nr:2-octaprenyl-6-methoxyphenyl hydroxylase [Thiohalomonas denitrificans]SCZ68333.1 2-octaprenyl-6-methoxyphenol hydroxylase [Thiohalomonas denitrificans]